MTNPASTISKSKHPTAEQLFDEVSWMGERLVEARTAIGAAPLSVTYLDSNGNERSKTNPAYEAYIALFNAFVRGANALDAVLADAAPEAAAAKLSLDSLRVMVGDKLKVAK